MSFSLFLDVAAEKKEKAMIDSIETFDATKLKHTETQEKNPLPDKEGLYLYTAFWCVLIAWFALNFFEFINSHDYSCVFFIFSMHLPPFACQSNALNKMRARCMIRTL